jgi:hypothetical protein
MLDRWGKTPDLYDTLDQDGNPVPCPERDRFYEWLECYPDRIVVQHDNLSPKALSLNPFFAGRENEFLSTGCLWVYEDIPQGFDAIFCTDVIGTYSAGTCRCSGIEFVPRRWQGCLSRDCAVRGWFWRGLRLRTFPRPRLPHMGAGYRPHPRLEPLHRCRVNVGLPTNPAAHAA